VPLKVLKIAVCATPEVVPPKAMTLPSGRSTCGPSSNEKLGLLQSASCWMVLPALIHEPVEVRYSSELVSQLPVKT
jgi:hypothetical protein